MARDVDAYRITGGETTIEVMTYGAILTRVLRPDRNGKVDDIVLGYDDPASYIDNPGNAGAILWPLFKPHQSRKIYAGRQGNPTAHQQRPAPFAWRLARLWQALLESGAEPARQFGDIPYA